MKARLGVCNIVLIGQFSPALFDKYFFVTNRIFLEEEILPSSIFSNIQPVQLITQKLQFFIATNQMVLNATIPEDDNEMAEIISKIIEICNIKTITAMGINFHWFLSDNERKLADFSKNFFFNDKLELYSKFFTEENAMFGLYGSVDFMGSRLKLDIKPTTELAPDSTGNLPEYMNFMFNFHFDITKANENTEVLSFLKKYKVYKSESQKMISLFNNN